MIDRPSINKDIKNDARYTVHLHMIHKFMFNKKYNYMVNFLLSITLHFIYSLYDIHFMYKCTLQFILFTYLKYKLFTWIKLILFICIRYLLFT